MEEESPSAVKVLNLIIRALNELDVETCNRVLRSAATFFSGDVNIPTPERSYSPSNLDQRARPGPPNFASENVPSPKQFMLTKQPRTDVELIACLAFYLTHYRNFPHFKTLDLAKLNTEAAQPKFSNTP
jgi:hypothetical protein